MCSSRSVDPSYRSRLKSFHLSGSGTSMIGLVNGCRRTKSMVMVVLTDLLIKDSPSISWVGTLSLVSSTGLDVGGEVKDLSTTLVGPVDSPPSISFFFISSFSLRRACISCSFFWTASSVLLFISAISLYRDNNNVWSASVILSMLLVETIYFLSASRWAPIVPAREMRPKELLKSLSSSFPRASC